MAALLGKLPCTEAAVDADFEAEEVDAEDELEPFSFSLPPITTGFFVDMSDTITSYCTTSVSKQKQL